jgi:chromosome segregation ATPase
MVPDYRREFEKERQRLAQLWDAHGVQGVELERLQRQVEQQEHLLYEKEKEIAAMRAAMGKRGTGDLSRDIQLAKADESMEEKQAEIQLLTDNLRDQQEQYKRLADTVKDRDAELKEAKRAIGERDRLISQLKTMLDSIDEQLETLRSP